MFGHLNGAFDLAFNDERLTAANLAFDTAGHQERFRSWASTPNSSLCAGCFVVVCGMADQSGLTLWPHI